MLTPVRVQSVSTMLQLTVVAFHLEQKLFGSVSEIYTVFYYMAILGLLMAATEIPDIIQM